MLNLLEEWERAAAGSNVTRLIEAGDKLSEALAQYALGVSLEDKESGAQVLLPPGDAHENSPRTGEEASPGARPEGDRAQG
jgi:hypothetical protein